MKRTRGILLFAALIVAVTVSSGADGQESGSTFTGREFHPVDFTKTEMQDEFWAPRIDVNRRVSIPHNIRQCETETKRINNFKLAAGEAKGEFGGFYFDDSDVYKILEGIANSLATRPDPHLLKIAKEWIRLFGRAQEDDGYLMTYFKLVKPEEKWKNLAGNHELYCAGHLAEAAVAYEKATNDPSLTKISRRWLDLICDRFGPREGQQRAIPGHEEIELALVRMYEHTGETKYLDEAQYFIEQRGVADGRDGIWGELAQDHAPIREQTEIVGHAVRAGYLYAAATDVACYKKDPTLLDAMKKTFDNATRYKSYVTGGLGSTRKNEGFEENYKLPNRAAYCETCASVALLFWAHRMNLATGDARYIDALERVAYNSFAAGFGLNGDRYFYVNPLEANGRHTRQPFFGCACCPSNVTRALFEIPGYFYATAQSDDAKAENSGDDTLVVNLYGQNSANVELADKRIKVEQSTQYPADGSISIRLTYEMKNPKARITPYYVKVRVPEWFPGDRSDTEKGYRTYKITPNQANPTTITLFFPTQIERLVANPNVKDDLGRVALRRGPIVYCFESADNPSLRVDSIVLPKNPKFQSSYVKRYISTRNDDPLAKNSAARNVEVITCQDVAGRPIVAIPYAVWDNRGAGRMAVWTRQDGLDPAAQASESQDAWLDADGKPALYRPLDPAILTDYAPEVDDDAPEFRASYLEDQLSTFDGSDQSAEPENSSDYGVPRATWYAHRGSEEYFEYEFAKPKSISSTNVYWFDDEAINGGCRVPESWKLLYQPAESDEWLEVETSDEYSVDKDREITVKFSEVTALKVRLAVKLREDYSGGILRWIVK